MSNFSSDVSRVTCVCLAAGLSSRMGGEHKLLREIQGRPVLQQTLEQLDPLPFAQKILVLGHEAAAFDAMTLSFKPVINPNFRLGLHSSIRTAVEAATGEALLITLADQPFGVAASVRDFFAHVGPLSARTLARAWHDSKPGHPVLIGRDYFERILAEPDGDYGCAYLFTENPFTRVELSEQVLWDLDTPDQFADFASKKI